MAVRQAIELESGDIITQPLNGMPASYCSGRVESTTVVDNGVQIRLSNQDIVTVAEDDRFEIEDTSG